MVDDARVTREMFRGLIRLSEPVPIPAPARRWSDPDWTTIRRGHRSFDMDDKWHAFVEGKRLFLHRSWTGLGIYEADFSADADGWRIEQAWVTGDRGVYGRGSDEYESVLLEGIIDGVLLRRWDDDNRERLRPPPAR